MRYESKHTYFKQVAVSLGNFINVPWTVPERHQKLQSLHFFNKDEKESASSVMKPLECGPGMLSHHKVSKLPALRIQNLLMSSYGTYQFLFSAQSLEAGLSILNKKATFSDQNIFMHVF